MVFAQFKTPTARVVLNENLLASRAKRAQRAKRAFYYIYNIVTVLPRSASGPARSRIDWISRSRRALSVQSAQRSCSVFRCIDSFETNYTYKRGKRHTLYIHTYTQKVARAARVEGLRRREAPAKTRAGEDQMRYSGTGNFFPVTPFS